MKNKSTSTKLSEIDNKSVSGWELAISEAKRRISALKRAIRTFQESRDAGIPFPEPAEATYESETGLLGQDGHLGQSPDFQIFRFSDFQIFRFSALLQKSNLMQKWQG